jgi:hypothetical protein
MSGKRRIQLLDNLSQVVKKEAELRAVVTRKPPQKMKLANDGCLEEDISGDDHW